MNDETRYWIAQDVVDTKLKYDASAFFREGKRIAGKMPETLITDSLPSSSHHITTLSTMYMLQSTALNPNASMP
jgi:hypothetical protein